MQEYTVKVNGHIMALCYDNESGFATFEDYLSHGQPGDVVTLTCDGVQLDKLTVGAPVDHC